LAIASTDQLATLASRQACHPAQLVRHLLQSGCADCEPTHAVNQLP